MEIEEPLLKFIWHAHQNTYAAAEGGGKRYSLPSSCLAGHIEYCYTEGDWRYQDIYSGFWSPPGKEVVYYKERPIWTMSYQGRAVDNTSDVLIKETYSFLKEALRCSVWEEPFRGPHAYSQGSFTYLFVYDGDYRYFKGREVVSCQGKEVFYQDIMGSLIL